MDLPYIIDVEASGFGRGSYPIEIGFVRPNGEAEARLITPLAHWHHWSTEAEGIHGLSREQLFEEGQSVVEVAEWLNHELAGLTVYSDSWGFDNTWIALLFDQAQRLQAFRVDTLSRLLSEAQLESWSQIKYQVQQQLGLIRHRAAEDARVLQQTLRLARQTAV
ncbi:hypothetical protein [Marinospirillum sp.]|uniref:3'-5' exonuclease n=1 Tax=Marinospirillum sp. TaxID=2183934 RepID=UPI003A88C4C2